MRGKAGWILIAVLALIFGLYPSLYYTHSWPFRLLRLKSPELLASLAWKAVFLTHITGGGLSLLIGWTQFSRHLRTRRPGWHRNIGKVYIAAALLAGLAGTVLSFTATGGFTSVAGFFILGSIWVGVTYGAWRSIRQGHIRQHQYLMIYSYACCFGAATLRLWLTGLGTFLDFMTTYRIVAWLSWVPNLLVAWLLVRQLKRRAAASLV